MAVKQTNKSRDALQEENTLLKEKLKELLALAKNKEEHVGLDHFGMGLSKINGVYKLVELKYNPITKEAQVTEVKDSSRMPEDMHMAFHAAKEYLVTKLFSELKKK